MCLSPSVPKLPPIRDTPKKDGTGALQEEARRRAKSAKGVFGNIFTTRLGDPDYGSNAKSSVTLGAG